MEVHGEKGEGGAHAQAALPRLARATNKHWGGGQRAFLADGPPEAEGWVALGSLPYIWENKRAGTQHTGYSCPCRRTPAGPGRAGPGDARPHLVHARQGVHDDRLLLHDAHDGGVNDVLAAGLQA